MLNHIKIIYIYIYEYILYYNVSKYINFYGCDVRGL